MGGGLAETDRCANSFPLIPTSGMSGAPSWLGWKKVKRGLVEAPELWRWGSFRAYAYQEKGPVGINQWSVPKLKTIEPTSFPT